MTRSRPTLIGTILSLLLAVAACSSPASTTTSASASASASATSASASSEVSPSTSASAQGSQTSAFDLEVGDCFNTEDVSTVDEVTVVDCTAPHVYEVFGLSDYEAGSADAYPGDDALNTAADDACRPAFEEYVGVSYDDSEWYGTFINPSEETWANGDREIVCVLHTEDETEVTESAEGSDR